MPTAKLNGLNIYFERAGSGEPDRNPKGVRK